MAKLNSFPSTGCCNSVDKRLLDFLVKRNNGKRLRLEGRTSVGWNTNSYWTIVNIDNSNKPKYEFKDLLPFLVPKPDVSSFEPYHMNETIIAGTRVIAISDDTVDDDYIIGDKGLVGRDIGSSMVEVKFDKDNYSKIAFKYHLAFLPEHQDAMLTDYDFDAEGDYDEEPSTLSYIPLTEKPRSNERVICLKDSETSNEYHIGWVGTVNDDNSNVPTIKWDNGIESVVYYTHLAYINETLKTHDMRIGEVYKLTNNNLWALLKVIDNTLLPDTEHKTIKSASYITSFGKYSNNAKLPIPASSAYRIATNFERDWMNYCIENGEFVSEADYTHINIEQREINKLIDKAHDKYPIGTYVRSLFHSNNPILKITSEVFSYYAEQKRVAGIGETSFLPIVYLDGKWAEIVTEKDYKTEQLLIEANKRYPVGSKVCPVHLGKGPKYIIITEDSKFKATDNGVFSYLPAHTMSSPDSKHGNGEWGRFLYSKGEWAELYDDSYELIVEAKRRYPIGTKVIPAHIGGNENYLLITEDSEIRSLGNDLISYVGDSTYNPNPKYGNTVLTRYLYSKGNWAKIYEETINFVRGKWYIGFYRLEQFIFKFDDQKDGTFYYSDMKNTISRGVYMNHGSFLFSDNDIKRVREVTQDELDKYLEDGHPDKTWIPKVGEHAVMVAAGGWGYSPDNNGCIGRITNVYKSNFDTRKYEISGFLLNPKRMHTSLGADLVNFTCIPIFRDDSTVVCRKATIDDMSKIVDKSDSMDERKPSFADVMLGISTSEPKEGEVTTLVMQKNKYTPTLELKLTIPKKVKKPVLDFFDESFKNTPFNRPLDLDLKKEKKKKINLVFR